MICKQSEWYYLQLFAEAPKDPKDIFGAISIASVDLVGPRKLFFFCFFFIHGMIPRNQDLVQTTCFPMKLAELANDPNEKPYIGV